MPIINKDTVAVKHGGTDIKAVYYAGNKIWPTAPAGPPPVAVKGSYAAGAADALFGPQWRTHIQALMAPNRQTGIDATWPDSSGVSNPVPTGTVVLINPNEDEAGFEAVGGSLQAYVADAQGKWWRLFDTAASVSLIGGFHHLDSRNNTFQGFYWTDGVYNVPQSALGANYLANDQFAIMVDKSDKSMTYVFGDVQLAQSVVYGGPAIATRKLSLTLPPGMTMADLIFPEAPVT